MARSAGRVPSPFRRLPAAWVLPAVLAALALGASAAEPKAAPSPRAPRPSSPPSPTGAPAAKDLAGEFSAFDAGDHRIWMQRGAEMTARQVGETLDRQQRLFFQVFGAQFRLQVPKAKMLAVVFRDAATFQRYWATSSPKDPGAKLPDGFYRPDRKTLCVFDRRNDPELARDRRTIEEAVRNARGRGVWILVGREKLTVREALEALEERAEGLNLRTLAHEATHQLAHECGLLPPEEHLTFRVGREELRLRTGCVPLWLHEGLAGYLENGPRAAWRWDPAKGFPDARHARRTKAMLEGERGRSPRLPGLLSAVKPGETEEEMLDFYAASWSLFHFLMHGDGGRYRPRLFDYLRAFGNGEAAKALEAGRPYSEADLAAFRKGEAPLDPGRFGPAQVALFEGHVGELRAAEAAWRRHVRSLESE